MQCLVILNEKMVVNPPNSVEIDLGVHLKSGQDQSFDGVNSVSGDGDFQSAARHLAKSKALYEASVIESSVLDTAMVSVSTQVVRSVGINLA